MSWANKRRLDPKSARQINIAPTKTVRNFNWQPEALDAFAQQHPDLIVRHGNDVLLGQPLSEQLTINYAFSDPEALRQGFASMLEQIEAANGGRFKKIYLNFDDHPNRTFIEPVLLQNAFNIAQEVLLLVREDLSSLLPEVRVIQPATEAGIEAIAALDQVCYEYAPLGPAEVKELVARGDELFTLNRDSDVAGYVYITHADDLTGHIARLGVNPDDRREGVGYTLMMQTLSLLASTGCVRATTVAPIERKAAVDLCKKAGFVPKHTVLLFAKEPGAKIQKTLGLIGLRGIWER
jgi:ribosomal protein S18 acetylase RimI-like enzyme